MRIDVYGLFEYDKKIFFVGSLNTFHAEGAVLEHEVASTLQVDVGEDAVGPATCRGVRGHTDERHNLTSGLAEDGNPISIERLTTLVVVKAIGNHTRVRKVLLATVGTTSCCGCDVEAYRRRTC